MDMASPECAYTGGNVQPLGRWAMNALLSVGILVPYLLKFLTFDIIGCGDSDKTVSATATMFSIIYVFAVTKAIEPFVCTKSSDGEWKSSLNPKLTCSFDTNWMILASAGAFLCFVFIVVYNAYLYRQLKHVDEDGQHEETKAAAEKLFDKILPHDSSAGETISPDDIIQALKSNKALGRELHKRLGLPERADGHEDEILQIVQDMDTHHSGSVDRNEFVHFFAMRLMRAWRKKFGFIIMKYKKDWQLWELCINLRKFLTVAALLLLAFDTSAQIIVMALIVLLFMILSVMCDDDGSFKVPCTTTSILEWEQRGPYRRKSSNILEFRLMLLQLLQLVSIYVRETTNLMRGHYSAVLLTLLGLGVRAN